VTRRGFPNDRDLHRACGVKPHVPAGQKGVARPEIVEIDADRFGWRLPDARIDGLPQ
jgi:hypothetical protein